MPLPGFLASGKRSSLARLNDAFAIVTLNPDGRILDANRLFCAMFGHDAQEMGGQSLQRFIYGAEENGRKALQPLLAGTSTQGELCLRTKAGQPMWLRVDAAPGLNSQGKVEDVLLVATDITREKEKALIDAAQMSAINRSQAIITFDLDGTVLEANENFLSVMGYGLDEVVGQHHSMFMSSDEAKSPAYKAFWDELRHGRFQSAEYRRFGKDGREVWIRATYNPVLGADGSPVKVVKLAVDVTAEKLRTADYEGQMEAIRRSQAVISFTLTGHILEANENFLSATGYALEEVKGKHHRMFVGKTYGQSAEYAEFWRNLALGKTASAIYQRYNKAGEPIWLQASYNPIFDASGKPVKIVKYATDITANMAARTRAIEAAESTLENVEITVASANEINASVDEIVSGMMRAKRSVDDIHHRTQLADQSTAQMRQTAESMDAVVQLIARIAEQINLLALNATIESARAGVAGKGFAVVASEVKNLAGQAAAATTRVSEEIAAMQTVSSEVDEALSSISAMVTEVQGFVDSATQSIEEQSNATRGISEHMQLAASGVAGVGRHLDNWIVGMEERRSGERERSFKAAVAHRGDGRAITCSLRNISETGAKLFMSAMHNLPSEFDLVIEGERSARRCAVVRKDANSIGIRFLQ